MDTQTTLPDRRETLAANFEAHEAGVLPSPDDTPPRARDDQGKFAKQDTEPVAKVTPVNEAVATADPPLARPTTWKKDYLPMWEKVSKGEQLTPEEGRKFLDYVGNQRENEYKSGVSTYRAEALQAKELQEAIAPLMPEFQANGITAKQWISEVGQAHRTLMGGSPEQKVQMLQALARRYGVPMQAVAQQGGLDPMVATLMGEIQHLKTQTTGINSWKTGLESQALQAEVDRISGHPEKYPHFEVLREQMAQYLETGAARDLDTAYKMAERMSDDLYEAGVAQRLAAVKPNTQQVVAQAKAKAVSPKSATPSGNVVAKSDAKDRRSMIAEKFDEVEGGRL